MTRLSIDDLRGAIAAKGWGKLPETTQTYDPDPIEPNTGLGSRARLDPEEVLDQRSRNLVTLRNAARLIALDDEYGAAFDRFLSDALGDD